MPRYASFLVLALVALALAVVPSGGRLIDVAGTAVTFAFFAAVGYGGVRLWARYRDEIESLSPRLRLVLYGSLALAAWALAAAGRLLAAGGGGLLLWLMLLALACYGLVWVWTRYRTLS